MEISNLTEPEGNLILYSEGYIDYLCQVEYHLVQEYTFYINGISLRCGNLSQWCNRHQQIFSFYLNKKLFTYQCRYTT